MLVCQFLAAGLDSEVVLREADLALPGIAVLRDQIASISVEVDVIDLSAAALPDCRRASGAHFRLETTADGRRRWTELNGQFRGSIEIIAWRDLVSYARARNAAFIELAR